MHLYSKIQEENFDLIRVWFSIIFCSFLQKCETCSKICSNKSNLNRHMGIHNKQKWICDYCDENFNQRQTIIAHMTNKHGFIQTGENSVCAPPNKKVTSMDIKQLSIVELIEFSKNNRIRVVCNGFFLTIIFSYPIFV